MSAEHLTVVTSDRGLRGLPPIPSTYGGRVQVYESSAASAPHIWLNAAAPEDLNRPDGLMLAVSVHLTAEDAWKLAEQLMLLGSDHYQGDHSPSRAQP